MGTCRHPGQEAAADPQDLGQNGGRSTMMSSPPAFSSMENKPSNCNCSLFLIPLLLLPSTP